MMRSISVLCVGLVLLCFVSTPAPAATTAMDAVYLKAGTILCPEADRLLQLHNAVRASNNCQLLRLSDQLCAAAQNQAEYMDRTGAFGHYVNGDPASRIASTGYACYTWAENIANGNQSPESAVNTWVNSGGHFANMVNRRCTEVGFGHAGGKWVAVFALPAVPVASPVLARLARAEVTELLPNAVPTVIPVSATKYVASTAACASCGGGASGGDRYRLFRGPVARFFFRGRAGHGCRGCR